VGAGSTSITMISGTSSEGVAADSVISSRPSLAGENHPLKAVHGVKRRAASPTEGRTPKLRWKSRLKMRIEAADIGSRFRARGPAPFARARAKPTVWFALRVGDRARFLRQGRSMSTYLRRRETDRLSKSANRVSRVQTAPIQETCLSHSKSSHIR